MIGVGWLRVGYIRDDLRVICDVCVCEREREMMVRGM